MSSIVFRLITLAALGLVLAGCASTVEQDDGPPPVVRPGGALPPDAVPRAEPRSRYGNPRTYVVFGKRYNTLTSADGFTERGTASWYGKKFHGRRTSSGETYDMHAMTAAHKHLPLPTYVRVTNLKNGRSTVVKVNDRGPFVGNRIIDLSYSAALKLDMVRAGTAPVEITALVPGALAAPRKTAPAPAAVYPATGGPHYVQAGAFVSADNAAQRLARVRSVTDAPAATRARLRGNVRYHVVWVGPFADRGGAHSVGAQLRNAGIVGVHLVKDH